MRLPGSCVTMRYVIFARHTLRLASWRHARLRIIALAMRLLSQAYSWHLVQMIVVLSGDWGYGFW